MTEDEKKRRHEQTQKACQRAIETGETKDLKKYMKMRREDCDRPQ